MGAVLYRLGAARGFAGGIRVVVLGAFVGFRGFMGIRIYMVYRAGLAVLERCRNLHGRARVYL